MAERVFQSGLGTEWERVYKEGNKVSSLLLAQVIKVNYKYNSVDLVTSGDKDTFRSSHVNSGKFSAKLPLEFGGRNSAGQPYGQVRPVNVGDTVLVGFIEQSKSAPVVLSVYGSPTVNEMLTRTPFDNADYNDETLTRQTNQKFSLYPSLTYDNIDGDGNRTVTFTGKSFVVVSAGDNKNSGVTDGNHGTEYDELETSYYANDEEIEPMSPYAPNILFKHQGILTQDGEEDNHVTLIGIKDDGTYRVSTMDKADDWRTYFEMTPKGEVKLRKQFDSKIIGQALKSSEMGIAEDGTVYIKNGDTYLEVKADGIYSNGLNLDVDLSEIQETLDEQGKTIVLLNLKVEQTAEKFAIIAEKTEVMEGQITDFRGELIVMADEISSKVSETQVKDIVNEELGTITEDITKIKEDNDRLNKIMEDIADDGLVTPLEKDTILREWLVIQDEYPTYVLQADDYEIDKTAYVKSYNDLDKYLTPLLANMEETTAIDPDEFRGKFKKYYDERLRVLTSILTVIKNMAVEAMKKASEASIDASNAWRDATQAQLDANKANSLISDIASDGKLTPSEKYELKREYDTILKEHPNVVAQGEKYEVDTTKYVASYTDLLAFVNTNRLFTDMGETVAVDGEQLRKVFSDYYLEKVKLLRAVTDKAKDITDEHEGRIYVAETQIKQTSEYIALLATKVETIGSTVETHTAELKVHSEEISQKVTATQVAKQISDLELGMTNNLRNSGLLLDATYWRDWAVSATGTRARVEIEGLPNLAYGFEVSKTTVGSWGYAQDNVAVLSDTEYTISFWARAKTGTVKVTLQKGNGADDDYANETKEVGLKWTRVSYTWKTKPTTTKTNYYLGLDGANNGTVIIAGMKLEAGSKATAWSASPLDSKAEIQDELSKLPIGGTNYVAFSSGNKEFPRLMIKNVGYYNTGGATGSFDGETVKLTPSTAGAQGMYDIGTSVSATARVGLDNYGLTAMKAGDYLTFSADVKVIGGTALVIIYLLNNGTWKEYRPDIIRATDGTKRAVASAPIDASTEGVLCRVLGLAGFTQINFAKVQLEMGMKSTSWKKSHFDLENDVNNAVTDSKNEIYSRGDNLITNGFGTLGNNTNFNSLAFDGVDKEVGVGAFKHTTSGGSSWLINEFIPADPTHVYQVSYRAKTASGKSRSYFFFAPYDVDKVPINVRDLGGATFSDPKPAIAKLVKPLKKGDTVVYLDNVSQFPNTGGNTHNHSIILWDYVDSFGKNYGTIYSKYHMIGCYNDGAVNATAKTITLSRPFDVVNKSSADGSFPIGHPVSKTNDSMGYMYPPAHTNVMLTTEYTQYVVDNSAYGETTGYKGSSATAYYKIGMLTNGALAGGDTTWINGVSMVDATTTKDLQVQLNGKEGSIMKQPNAPTNPAVGLIWVDTTNVPNVAKRWTGTAWVKLSPTEAQEIGAFSDSDGRDLIDRMSSAEQVITAESITNTVLSSEDFSSLFNSKANAEDLLNLATTEQLENQYSSFEAMLEQQLGEAYSTLFERQSELEQLVNGFDFKIQQAGGINMLRNSLGFSGLDFWGDTNDHGKNLIRKADFSVLGGYWTNYTGGTHNVNGFSTGIGSIKNTYLTSSTAPYQELTNYVTGEGGQFSMKPNTVYTLSFMARGTSYIRTHVYPSSLDTSFKAVIDGVEQSDTISDGSANHVLKSASEWNLYTYTFKTNSSVGANLTTNLLWRIATKGATVEVAQPKLEEGYIATPWSLAPEDISASNSLTETTQDNALANLGFGSGFVHKAGGVRLIQNVTMPAKGTYTMSFFMKKSTSSGAHGGAGIELFSNGDRLAFIGAEEGIAVGEYTKYSYTFDTVSLDVSVQMVAWGNMNTTVTMSGLMFNIGTLALTWQPFPSEIYNTNVLIDINGITVKNNQTNGYTLITPTEFSGYAQVGTEMKRIFTLNGKTTEVEEIKIRTKLMMGAITVLAVATPKNTGWAFIGQ